VPQSHSFDRGLGEKKRGIFCRPLVVSKWCPFRTSLRCPATAAYPTTVAPLFQHTNVRPQGFPGSHDSCTSALLAVTSRTRLVYRCRPQVWLVDRHADLSASTRALVSLRAASYRALNILSVLESGKPVIFPVQRLLMNHIEFDGDPDRPHPGWEGEPISSF
jgi:hypothetical protein